MAAVSALNKAHFDSIANQYDASDLAIERAEKFALSIGLFIKPNNPQICCCNTEALRFR